MGYGTAVYILKWLLNQSIHPLLGDAGIYQRCYDVTFMTPGISQQLIELRYYTIIKIVDAVVICPKLRTGTSVFDSTLIFPSRANN